MRAVARAVLAMLAMALAAAAVQPLVHVAPDVLFLPNVGVAISARNGHVLWRFPRFHGQARTDGNGLLLVSWVSQIDTIAHERITRVCRLDAQTGRQIWCRDWLRIEEWTLDTTGKAWYVRTPGRLRVLGVSHGRIHQGFNLPIDQDLSLMPLPEGGALVLERRRGRAVEAFAYKPGAVSLDPEVLPPTAYPFRGDGSGLLFYARQKGEFFLAAPLRLLFGRPPASAPAAANAQPDNALGGSLALAAPDALETSGPRSEPPSASPSGLDETSDPEEASHFPRASVDDQGFFFTDWQGRQPILRGGTYDGAVWQAPRRAAHPQLALTRRAAVMLEPGEGRNPGNLSAFDRATGAPLFSRSIPGGEQAMSSDGDGVVLQSRAVVCLLDGSTGRQLWTVPNREGPLAVMAGSSIVFWEGGGQLAGLARDNGKVLWRVRFKQEWTRHWF